MTKPAYDPWWPFEVHAKRVTVSGEPIRKVGCTACAGRGNVPCNVCQGRGWTVAVIIPQRAYR